MKPYPTYTEYECPYHPELGWLSDHGNPSVWRLHTRGPGHPEITQMRWRELPHTEEMERTTQYGGWPVNVHELLVEARR